MGEIRKYELTGELGGFVEKEENLKQSGDAWVSGHAEVSGVLFLVLP